LIRTWK
jgi:hypothetical protein